MAPKIELPRGTADVLPADSAKWQFVEQKLRELASAFGLFEIRTPTFESTDLFCRGVGDTTDIVQKEMYTFEDKGGRSITLRPEGTAGAMRAVLQHGLFNEALPLSTFYFVNCFRYEKPQAGRLREFHQFGAEVYGSASPAADAELIVFASNIFKMFGLNDVWLELNSIGCKECRPKYHAALKEYFTAHQDELCDTCRDRLNRNPMRILDCKSPVCQQIAAGAPKVLDYICEHCRADFEQVQARLDGVGLAYTVNPGIVRGLDYYNGTVFEFVSGNIGAQSTVLGGGRYDGLAEQLGGKPLPALGFAMGLERLILTLENSGYDFPGGAHPDIYLANIGQPAALFCFKLASRLRDEGLKAAYDQMERSLKAQMKYADKLGARYTAVIGEDEMQNGQITLKNMQNGQSVQIAAEQLGPYLKNN